MIISYEHFDSLIEFAECTKFIDENIVQCFYFLLAVN